MSNTVIINTPKGGTNRQPGGVPIVPTTNGELNQKLKIAPTIKEKKTHAFSAVSGKVLVYTYPIIMKRYTVLPCLEGYGCFNQDEGSYTVPETGLYQISYSISTVNSSRAQHSVVNVSLVADDNTLVTDKGTALVSPKDGVTYPMNISNTIIVNLKKGTKVTVQLRQDTEVENVLATGSMSIVSI